MLSYRDPHPLLLGEAVWVPLLFGAAGVGLTLTNAALLPAAGAPGGSARRIVASVAWFFAAYAATASFQDADGGDG